MEGHRIIISLLPPKSRKPTKQHPLNTQSTPCQHAVNTQYTSYTPALNGGITRSMPGLIETLWGRIIKLLRGW
jgi:hypothetical protein